MLRALLREKFSLRHDDALLRMAQRNIEVGTIIDVGAAKGAWTKAARRHWPEAHAHLIEAKEDWRSSLTSFQQRTQRTTIEIAGVTDRPGEIFFPNDATSYGGAVFKEPAKRDNLERIKATSIDHEVERLCLAGPYAIKLDTHGTEVDILNGACNTLERTSFLCIETYNFIGQKRFPQLVLDMEGRGFRCADMAEPLLRPGDNMLWQVDFYFMRAEHPSFSHFGFLP